MELTDKKFLLKDNQDKLSEDFEPIWTFLKAFLDELYKSPHFISKLISLSNPEDLKEHIAPFFTNNFYENILSCKGIENNLIFIIYLLLKEEINSLSNINDLDKFLEKTPCGYILEQLVEKIDIKSFCKLNVSKVVKDLEWTFSGKNISLDVEKIIEKLKKAKELQKANSVKDKTKKSYSIFSANEDFLDNNATLGKKNNVSFVGFEEKGSSKHNKNMEDSVIFNSKYILNINPKTIDYKKYNKFDSDNIKEFFESQDIDTTSKNSWGKFSNDNFINNIFQSGESENILSIYIISFIKVIESINILFKALLENASIIPYSIKCICKIIYVLLLKKFPNIKRLQLNAFISRFFFNKLLLPLLENPIYGALITEYIISPETISNIKIVSDIISRICAGKLYNKDEEKGNFTPFNNFMLEKIVDLYKLYQNIEEVILPDFIEKDMTGKLVKEKMEENINEPIIFKSICFSIEELNALFINISKNKSELFVDESTKNLSMAFNKIDKKNNMKKINDLLNEKTYEDIPGEIPNKKNDNKKQNKDKDVKKREIKKYYLYTDFLINKEFSEIYNLKEKAHFTIKELEKINTKENIDKNNIIKIKNYICTLLYYLRELNVSDFNPISSTLNNSYQIFKEIKKFIKCSYFVTDDKIPLEWYINSILQRIGKLPKSYIENDYELLYKELKSDIEQALNILDYNKLSNISEYLKYGNRKKMFYENAYKNLKDIKLNQKVHNLLNKLIVPCELYFCYNDKEKALKVREIKKDDNTLSFLDSMIFVEKSKYVKTCKIIKDFTRCFPNIVKSLDFFGENEKIIQMLEELKIPDEIKKYLKLVKDKLEAEHNFNNEEERQIINNKIYDFVMEKIYDKIFPTFKSDNDIKINVLCKKLSWTEPKNYIDGDKNYVLDSFLPDAISNFLKMEKVKSPRKKFEYIAAIFTCVKNVQDFNGADGNKAGADDIANIIPYTFIKSILTMPDTNLKYLQLFVNSGDEEDQQLTQLLVASQFVLEVNHEKLRVTKEEYDENCEKSYCDYKDNNDLYDYTYTF